MPRRYVFAVPVGPGSYDRLRGTLASLAAQDRPIAIAFCHAGPREAVADILKPYARFIAYERHAPDAGQSAAINEGWKALEGDVYGWLNADDMLAPGALAKADALFDADASADVVCGQSIILDDDNRFTGLHPAVKAPDADLFRSNIISQPSCIVSAQALRAVGLLGEDLHYSMDWDLWVRLMEAGRRFAYTPDVLSAVLWGHDTKTSTLGLQRLSEIRAVVARRRRPFTTAKTLVGFTLHHLSEYTLAGGPMKRARSMLKSGRLQEIKHWGQADVGKLEFDIFHYREASASDLRLRFRAESPKTICVDGMVVYSGHEADVRLNVSVASGRLVRLRIEGADLRAEDLASVELLDATAAVTMPKSMRAMARAANQHPTSP